MRISGAQALIKSLENEGVEVMFGYPGGQIMPTYDVLLDSKMRHILTRHEQGAAHAADGYARATGKVGVCISTSGPGATNLVTGLATAGMDSSALVAITGQVATHVIGTDAFQEADTTGITLPVVKHNYLIKHPSEIAGVVQEAFLIASTGRRGAVLIDLPSDVQRAEFDYKKPERITKLPGYKPTTAGHSRQIKEAARRIIASKRPVIYAGGGVIAAEASRELRALARLLDIPVTTTLMAKGAFPETHRLSLGMLGMHGTSYANYVMMESDLIVAVGARFDDRITGRLDTFATHARKIHIDIDPAEIGKNVPVDVPIVGDAKKVLKDLIEVIKPLTGDSRKKDLAPWHRQISKWKKEYPLLVPDAPVPGLPDPAAAAAAVKAQLKANLGLLVEPEVVPAATFAADLAAGSIDGLYLSGVTSSLADASGFLEPLFGRSVTTTAAGRATGVANALETLARTTGTAARAAVLAKANDAVRATVPISPLVHPGSVAVYRSDVTGVAVSPLGLDALGSFVPGDRHQLVYLGASEPGGAWCGNQATLDAFRLCGLVSDGLYRFAPGTLDPQPRLAVRCTPNTDATTWTCRLRPGVTFGDGMRLDAGDVLASFVAQWDGSSPLRTAGPPGAFASWDALFGGPAGG